MTEAFDAGGIEDTAINRLVAEADNRDQIDHSHHLEAMQGEDERLLGQAESIWNSLGFEYDFSELSDTMGSTWDTQSKNLLARVPTGLGVRTVTRPIQFGARTVTCSRTFTGDSSTDIKALHGKVLMYRTHDPDRTKHSEQYVDRGFYCFVLQVEHSKTSQPSPVLVYGDLDEVQWPRNSFKPLFIYKHLRDGRNVSDFFSHADQNANLSFELKDRLVREDLKKVGVFRQNQTPIISEQTDPHTRYQVRAQMQAFIDAYLDPEQTKPEVIKQAQDRIITASQIHGLAGAAALTDFDLSHAALRIQSERDTTDSTTASDTRIKKVKSQIKQPSVKYLSSNRLEESVVVQEFNFPLIMAIRQASPHCEPMAHNQIVYELVGSKVGEALVNRLMHNELTPAELAQVHQLDGSIEHQAMMEAMRDFIKNRESS